MHLLLESRPLKTHSVEHIVRQGSTRNSFNPPLPQTVCVRIADTHRSAGRVLDRALVEESKDESVNDEAACELT